MSGLIRFKAAQDWLDGVGRMQSPAEDQRTPAEFRKFLDERKTQARMSTDEAARLYSDFLKWQRSKETR